MNEPMRTGDARRAASHLRCSASVIRSGWKAVARVVGSFAQARSSSASSAVAGRSVSGSAAGAADGAVEGRSAALPPPAAASG